MYIKEVELKNFKSFGKRVFVPLKNDFVAVTGPNGSGKSNIIDALLFALCLSNSRAMRAERLPDLIYRGDNGNNPNFAQVTVRLDNSNRTMPLESDIIDISRKITANKNKYFSSYYFNGKPCSQGELHDYLAKAGITPEGYNVVMQGDVTRIIEMTPTERRKIVDEIAGVAEFDEKKKKSIEELDIVRERIGRVDVILEEVSSQLFKLKEERDKALSYQAYREEKRRQEAFLLLAKLKESESDLSGLENEAAEMSASAEELRLIVDGKKSEHISLEAKLSGLNSEITHKGEDEQIEVKRKIEEIKAGLALGKREVEISDRAIVEVEAGQKEAYIQADRLAQEGDVLGARIRDASMRQASLKGELMDQAEDATSARASIAEADSKYSKLKDLLSSARQEREEGKTGLGDLLRERDRLLDGARRGTAEREEIATYIAEACKTISQAEAESSQIRSELATLNEKALTLERDKDDLEGSRLRIKREISESDRDLQRLQGEFAKAEARLRAAEERSGYSRAVEAIRSAIRRQLLRGLHGTIAELGDVNQKYASALEVAAGARLQSIVSDDDECASVAIDYLKRSQIGRATFLPLNKLDDGDLPQAPKRPGVVDYALNLVKFEDKFFSAFWYVFRDTLVVENLDAARGLMGRHRMVTLDGDLVEKSGAMTGGHYKSRLKFAADEGSRLLELQERISSQDSLRSALLYKLDKVEEEISRIGKEIDELDKAISRKTFRLEEVEGTRPRVEKSVEERKARLIQMEGESSAFKDRLGAMEADIQRFESQVRDAQSRIEGLERDLSGSDIPELTAKLDAAESEVRRLQERIREIDAEITKDRLKSESIVEKLRELSSRRESLDAQKLEAEGRKLSAMAKISELKEAHKAMEALEKEIEFELHGLKGERFGLLENVLAAQREVDRVQRELERVEARMKVNAASCQDVRTVVDALRGEIEACGIDSAQTPPRSEAVSQKIRSIDKAMQDLEPVNMLAIDEYDQVLGRHDVLQDRRETLSREREEILAKLDKYDQMKNDSFLEAFKEINANFKEIFRELSNGEGELLLEAPDDPLSGGMTIKARPSGKAFHRLEAMSGGEKSLTALSFIFAIQRHKPAPFYAMDEIDMFLDGANVERVAKLIKKISSRAQFIVVSLRKPMIQQAKYAIGVTMQENNLTSVTGICVN